MRNKEYFSDFVYTPLEQIDQELERRSKSSNLGKIVKNYFQDDFPRIMNKKRHAILFRQICSPNHEFRLFMQLAKKMNLNPLFIEFCRDKFTTYNQQKHSLAKLQFQDCSSEKARIIKKTIIEFNIYNGEKFVDVETKWGQKLIDFHHEILRNFLPEFKEKIFEASDWFYREGRSAKEFYKKYLMLFLKDNVLFENFILEGSEQYFTETVFLPPFLEIYKETGFKPLIVQLLPSQTENSSYWNSYPIALSEFVFEKLMTS